MPLTGERKNVWQREYMRQRRENDKAFAWEKALRLERLRLKKALHRLALAEKWASDGEKIEECWLSLAWHWNQITAEEEAKNAKSVAVQKPPRKRKTAATVLKKLPAAHVPVPPRKLRCARGFGHSKRFESVP